MLQTADFDVESFEQRKQHEEDKKLLVKFFVKPRPDAVASKEEGRPIFKDVEYIDIKIPGDRTGGICRPATHQDKQRFGEHYKAFKERVAPPVEGTPLIEWPLITRSLAEELAFHNVKTVEHLVSMSDNNAAKFMGLNGLKAKAKVWLEQAADEAADYKLLEMKEQLAARDAQIAEMTKKLNQLIANQVAPGESASLGSALDDAPKETVATPAAPKKQRRRRVKATENVAIQDDK